MLTRKQFISNSLTALAGAGVLGQYAFRMPAAKRIAFDLHAHPGQLYKSEDASEEANPNAMNTIAGMEPGQLSGLFLALVADSKLLVLGDNGVSVTGGFKEGEGWADYQRQLKIVKDFLQHSTMRFGTSSEDLTPDKVTAFLAVEGGHFLEGDAGRLEEAYVEGVRSVQLVHYAPNELGDLQTWEVQYKGLSAAGKEVVKRMNRLGMLIDVAHASFDTTKQVAMITKSPIMLSHSVLKMEAGRPIEKRAITKEHAKIVADTGGVIGMWPSGFNHDFQEYVENTLRMVDVVGIDHVGIGTDMDANYKPVLSSYSQYPDLSQALADKGLSNVDVAKIMGDNAVRVIREVIG